MFLEEKSRCAQPVTDVTPSTEDRWLRGGVGARPEAPPPLPSDPQSGTTDPAGPSCRPSTFLRPSAGGHTAPGAAGLGGAGATAQGLAVISAPPQTRGGTLWVPGLLHGHRSALLCPRAASTEGSVSGLMAWARRPCEACPLGPPRFPFGTPSPAPSPRVCSSLRRQGCSRWSRPLVLTAPHPGLPAPAGKSEGSRWPRFGAPLLEGLTRGRVLAGPGHVCSPAPRLWGCPPARLPFGRLQGQGSSWPVTSSSCPADLPAAATPGPQRLLVSLTAHTEHGRAGPGKGRDGAGFEAQTSMGFPVEAIEERGGDTVTGHRLSRGSGSGKCGLEKAAAVACAVRGHRRSSARPATGAPSQPASALAPLVLRKGAGPAEAAGEWPPAPGSDTAHQRGPSALAAEGLLPAPSRGRGRSG